MTDNLVAGTCQRARLQERRCTRWCRLLRCSRMRRCGAADLWLTVFTGSLPPPLYKHDQRICNDCQLETLAPGVGPRGIRFQTLKRVMDPITPNQLTSMIEGVG